MKTVLKSSSLLLIFIANLSIGQELVSTRDIGLWIGLALDYEVYEKWDFFAKQEIRTFNNAIKVQRSITDCGLAYAINKEFKLTGGLRYAYNREKDYTFSHNIRYNIDLKYKKQIANHLALQYRFRFQSNYESLFTGFDDFKQRNKARNRLRIEYERKKNDFYFSSELFRVFVNYRKPKFNNLRLVLGDKIESKWGEYDLGLGYEVELGADSPFNFFFLKMGYTIKSSND